ncbi:hypothetical protein MMC30_007334 [Trapelia coarctata]|nr:hypothetical protein [Trapelia coarctata]
MVMKRYREFEGVDPDEPRQKPNKSKKQSNPAKYKSRFKKEQGALIPLPELSKPSEEEGELPSVELNAFKEQPLVLPTVDKADLTILTAQQKPFSVQKVEPLIMESPSICVQEQPCGLESVLQHDQHHTARALSGAASDDRALHQAKVQGDTLEDMVQHCQTRFRDRGLKIFNDERSETINPEEIKTFFARFHEGQWLSNVNIMPLIFSFDWPHTTAVLDSDYANIKPGTKARPWPIHPHHTRIILPCCSQFHWTLFDINSETRTIRCYNSLGDVVPEVLKDIMVRLKDAMTWIDEPEKFIICSAVNNPVLQQRSSAEKKQASQQQQSSDDCGIFTIYNAECLALKRDPIQERVDGRQLRYRYLKSLLELGDRGETEQDLVSMVTSGFKIKRRIIEDQESDSDPRKYRRIEWTPPSHLGPEVAWITARDRLATNIKNGCKERAQELLYLIEAVGCEEVKRAWDDTMAREKDSPSIIASLTKVDSITSIRLHQLLVRATDRCFRTQVVLRIGKWMFAMKILRDVENLREKGPPSKQSASIPTAEGEGNAVTRALTAFVKEVHPSMEPCNVQDSPEYRKYRQWRKEGQIWILLSRAFGAGILLLIPNGHCIRTGHKLCQTDFITIKAPERECFIDALQNLRPDLRQIASQLSKQLATTESDIADLLRFEGTTVAAKPDSITAIDLSKVTASKAVVK